MKTLTNLQYTEQMNAVLHYKYLPLITSQEVYKLTTKKFSHFHIDGLSLKYKIIKNKL